MKREMKMTRSRLWAIRSLAGELVERGHRSDGDILVLRACLRKLVAATRSRVWGSALDFIELDSRERGQALLRRSMADLELKIRRAR